MKVWSRIIRNISNFPNWVGVILSSMIHKSEWVTNDKNLLSHIYLFLYTSIYKCKCTFTVVYPYQRQDRYIHLSALRVHPIHRRLRIWIACVSPEILSVFKMESTNSDLPREHFLRMLCVTCIRLFTRQVVPRCQEIETYFTLFLTDDPRTSRKKPVFVRLFGFRRIHLKENNCA